MENMFKRFLSLALAVLMVVSMMPTTAFATETETGDNTQTETGTETPVDGDGTDDGEVAAQAESITGTITEDTVWNDGDIVDGVTISGNVTITVNGTVTVKNCIILDAAVANNVTFKAGGEGATLIRGSEYTGTVIQAVGTSEITQIVTIDGITLDGGAVWTGGNFKTLNRGTTNTGVVATNYMINAQYAVVNFNAAVVKNHGGGTAVIHAYAATLNMADSTVCNNFSNNGYYYGGFVTMRVGATFIAEDSTFYGNHGDVGSIAGVSASGSYNATMKFTGCKFYNNYAPTGGLFRVQDSSYSNDIGELTLNGCEIYSNSSEKGLIYSHVYGTPIYIVDTKIYGNESSLYDYNSRNPNIFISGNTQILDNPDYSAFELRHPIIISGELGENANIAMDAATVKKLMDDFGYIASDSTHLIRIDASNKWTYEELENSYQFTDSDWSKFSVEGYAKYFRFDVDGDGVTDIAPLAEGQTAEEITVTLKDQLDETAIQTTSAYSNVKIKVACPFTHEGYVFSHWLKNEDTKTKITTAVALEDGDVLTACYKLVTPAVVLSQNGAILTATVTNVFEGMTYTYQWSVGGKAVPGATEATYTITSFDSAKYTCKVTVTDGTLKASANKNLTTALTAVAQIGETKYGSLTEAIAAANAVEGGATVTLLQNVTLDKMLTISGNVTIEGAYTITRAAAYAETLFEVAADATLTLDGGLVVDGGNAWTYTKTPLEMDMANGAGTYVGNHITPAAGGVNATKGMIVNKGTLNANKVTIQNSYSTNGVSAIDCGASSVTTLNGATLKNIAANRSGAVVYVGGADAVLTIKGETRITGNFGIGNGGIIQNYGQGTTVNLEGGSIDNNHVGKSGTVYASYSSNANKINTFNMSGGIITKNIMEGYGPVYIHTNTVWNMTGGEISENTSFLPSYVRSNNNAATISGGKIVNNEITGVNYSSGYYVTRPDIYLGTNSKITGGTFTQNVFEYLAADTGLVYDEATGTYSVTDHVYNLYFRDPVTGEQVQGVGPLKGNDPASLVATGKLFYADYYKMELEVLCDAKIDETIVIDYPMTVNLNGHTITTVATAAGTYMDAFTILADVTVTGEGKVDARASHGYTFYVGDTNDNAGNLTIENGTFYGEISVVNNRLGTVTINGGKFAVTPYKETSTDADGNEVTTENYNFLLNCIDANYNAGTAQIVVNGGTFYKFDPANNAAEGTGTSFVSESYISEELTEGYFTVREANYVAQVGETKYESLAEAIAAAQDGDTVTLLTNCAEDVTITQKSGVSFTIDGAKKTYTGTITVDGNKRSSGKETLTIQNVNFVGGSINTKKSTYAHNITVSGCSFDGGENPYNAIILRHAYNIVIKDTTAKNLNELVYNNYAVTGLTVENVNISNTRHGFWLAYGTNMVFRNVTVEATGSGLNIQNQSGAVTTVVEDCTIKAPDAVAINLKNASKGYTLSFTGNNDFSGSENWVTVAGQGETVTVDGLKTDKLSYDKSYYVKEETEAGFVLRKGIFVAMIGEDGYETFDAALAAAKAGENKVITLLQPVTITADTTYDLTGITVESEGEAFIVTGGTLTLNGDGVVKGGTSGVGSWCAVGANGGHVVINGGTYSVGGDPDASSAIFTQNGGTATINGGTFLNDGTVWTLNENDDNRGTITVKGGTFQNWNPENNASEGEGTNFVADGYAAIYDEAKNTYTVVDYIKWIKAELLAGNDVTLDRDITVGYEYVDSVDCTANGNGQFKNWGIFTVISGDVTFDLNGHNVTFEGHSDEFCNKVAFALFYANNGGKLTVTGEGNVTVNGMATGAYSTCVGSELTIEGGNWVNNPCTECDAWNTFLYASHGGALYIKDGSFAQNVEDNYLIVEHTGYVSNNDALVDYSKTVVEITGGSFKGMNPEEARSCNQKTWNSQEWGTTNVVAKGYKSEDNGDGTWTVVPNQIFEMHLVDANGDAHWLSPMRSNDLNSLIEKSKVWYESLQGTYSFTLKILESYELDETVLATFPMTIDLCGKTLTVAEAMNATPAIRVLSDVTVKNGTVDATAGTSTYAFIVGNSTTAGTLTIVDGTYKGRVSVASVTKGTLTIEGGNFEATEYEGAHEFTLNCIDANYTAGTAKIVVKGGTFVGFNPEANAAEGADTNFVAEGYGAEQDGENYIVKPVITVTFDNLTMVDGNELPEFTYTTNFTEIAEDGMMLIVKEPAVTVNGVGEYEITAEASVFMSDAYIVRVTPGTLTVVEAVAQVGNVYYASLQEAINACTNGETVKLIADITYGADDVVYAIGGATGFGDYPNPSIIFVGGTKGATDDENQPSNVNAVIDLNGHTITNNADAYLFLFMDNCKITFKDSVGTGAVVGNAEAPVIWSAGTETVVTIESGKYSIGEYGSLIWATHSGDLVIKGGEFSTTAEDASCLIMRNEKNRQNSKFFITGKSVVTVTGGTFHGFNPEKMLDDSKTPAYEFNAVAEGYKAVADEEANTWTVMTVIEAGYVAQNTTDGVYYKTVAEALKAAVSGETVILITNASEGYVMVTPGTTLDLNGYTLTADYVVGFNGSNVVDNSEANTGLLVVADAKNVVLAETNSQLPVWTGEGYIFVEILKFNTIYYEDNMQYVFQPVFEEVAHEYLLNGMNSSNVKIAVRMSWTTTTGMVDQDFVYIDEQVQMVVNSYSASTGKYSKAYSLTLTSVDQADFTLNVVVISATGVELSAN